MRVTTLIENLAYDRGLRAEHGLAFYIETRHKKILFDTGQSGCFIDNADALGIDLKLVDAVIISHGHYDHIGGLYPFLNINKKANVFIKKEAFQLKYHGFGKFIGSVYNSKILDGRVKYVDSIMEVDQGVFIIPEIPVRNPIDLNFNNFKIKNFIGFAKDLFQDELFLCLVNKKKISILSSCSHRGITNILEAAVCRFNLPVNTVIGGFHLKDSSPDQIHLVKLYLEKLAVKSVGICHCTGVDKYAEFRHFLPDKVFYNFTGNILEI